MTILLLTPPPPAGVSIFRDPPKRWGFPLQRQIPSEQEPHVKDFDVISFAASSQGLTPEPGPRFSLGMGPNYGFGSPTMVLPLVSLENPAKKGATFLRNTAHSAMCRADSMSQKLKR